jgi:isochorismate synthase
VFWSVPEEQLCFLGMGAAARVAATGADCIERVRVGLRQFAQAADGVTAGTAFWFGGMAFRAGERRSPWTDWPDAEFILPRLLIRPADGETAQLTAFVVVAEETSLEQEIHGLQEEMADLLAADHHADSAQRPGRLQVGSEPSAERHWKDAVAETAADIRRGKFDKVVLARSERLAVTEGRFDLGQTLARLEQIYPGSHVFAFWEAGTCFLGASPERLVSLEGDDIVIDCLAGTTARGATPQEDAELAQQLLASRKDLHEHAVVRRWILEQLQRAGVTAIEWTDQPAIRKLANVQHLHTPIRAQRTQGMSVLDLVQVLHPTPAVAGVPREQALAVIESREGMDRGWYAGPIGWMTDRGDGQFAVALRSALVCGTEAHLFAGAGIMGDSDSDSEWKETEMKLSAIKSALLTPERGNFR